jgi:hypothetical protein
MMWDVKTKNSRLLQDAVPPLQDTTAPLPITHLVRQGTEPDINNSRFGFSAAGPSSVPLPTIDPALLALQGPQTGSAPITVDTESDTENSSDADICGDNASHGSHEGHPGDVDNNPVTNSDARQQFGIFFFSIATH